MPEEYKRGRRDRHSGKTKNQCPYPAAHRVRQAWWYAGWHDADMELGYSQTLLDTTQSLV